MELEDDAVNNYSPIDSNSHINESSLLGRMVTPAFISRTRRAPNLEPLASSEFYLYVTHCMAADNNRMFIKGVVNHPDPSRKRATNVGLVVNEAYNYFFLQFKSDEMNPLQYPKRVESYINWLERTLRQLDHFQVPVGGDIGHLQSTYNPVGSKKTAKHNEHKQSAGEQGPLFIQWRAANDIYKTVYGYTPDNLSNLIQVWVSRPEVVKAVCKFIDSREYRSFVTKLHPHYVVRAFEGAQSSFEQQFLLDRGLSIGKFVRVRTALVNPFDQSMVPRTPVEMYVDYEFVVSECDLSSVPDTIPLSVPYMNVMSYDCETNNISSVNPYTGLQQSRFSKAIWKPVDMIKHFTDQKTEFKNGIRYRREKYGDDDAILKKLLSMTADFNAAIETLIRSLRDKKPWDNLSEWYDTMSQSYAPLAPFLDIPNPLNVDEVLVIVAVLNVYNCPRSKPLEFPEAVAFVLIHPSMTMPIDRSLLPTKYSALSDQYKNIKLHTFDCQLKMIGAFIEQLHEWSPTLLTGWNDSNFDAPYIWNVCQHYSIYYKSHRYGRPIASAPRYTEHGVDTLFNRPNFGLLRKYKMGNLVEGRIMQNASASKKSGQDEEDAAESEDENEEENLADNEFNLYATDTDPAAANLKKKSKKKATAANNNNPARISQAMKTHVTMPMLTSMDAMVVWQNQSFGVKSVFEGKGTTPQYKLDNVSSIELRYPESDKELPRRKLQVSHEETPHIWKKGGKDLWFFICYCYVDATLPLFLLEKHAKIQLLFALARECNCALDIIYNNGMQVKISSLFFAASRVYKGGQYLIPEWGLLGLHWPDVWLSENPYTKGFSFAYLKPRPPGTKGYMGALVMDPTRMLHADPLPTLDFASLYPNLAASYHFDYDKFLTEFTIQYYKIPSNMFARQILGPAKVIFCGEVVQSETSAEYDRYNVTTLKEAKWMVHQDGFVKFLVLRLSAQRSAEKDSMAKMTYYNKLVSVSPAKWPPKQCSPEFAAWNAEMLAPQTLREKIGGKYWEVFAAACTSHETYSAEYARIESELLTMMPGSTDLVYISGEMIRVFDAAQLALKLILNSIYGFTAPSLQSATLPLMELAASITSQGRRVIRATGAFCESQKIRELAAHLATLKSPYQVKPVSAVLGDIEGHSNTIVLDTHTDVAAGTNLQTIVIPKMGSFKFASREDLEACKEHYDRYRSRDHLQVHGGDTDSVMIGYPRAYCIDKSSTTNAIDFKMVQQSAVMIARLISGFLHGSMSLTQEKTSKTSLMIDPKNYYMSTLNSKEILCKGVEIVRGDTFGFCNRLIGYAAREIIHKSSHLNFTETVLRVFKYFQDELIKVAQGKVVLSEFIKHKKLAKLMYTNIPEHVVVAEKMRRRGKDVHPGDYIVYTYADTVNPDDEKLRLKRFDRDETLEYVSKRGGQIAEDVSYLIESNGKLDVEHCFNLIVTPCIKFFRHIISPHVYPPIDEMLPNSKQNLIKTIRSQIRSQQNDEVYELLFKRIDMVLKERLRVKMLKILKQNTITSLFLRKYEKECEYCSLIFEAFNQTQTHCTACIANTRDIQHTLSAAISQRKQEIEATKITCRDCIDFAGFPDIEIEKCTKYDCEVYERRSRLTIDLNQASQQLATIRLVGGHRGLNDDDDERHDTKRKKKSSSSPRHLDIEFDPA